MLLLRISRDKVTQRAWLTCGAIRSVRTAGHRGVTWAANNTLTPVSTAYEEPQAHFCTVSVAQEVTCAK
jgi:hypothetical protein